MKKFSYLRRICPFFKGRMQPRFTRVSLLGLSERPWIQEKKPLMSSSNVRSPSFVKIGISFFVNKGERMYFQGKKLFLTVLTSLVIRGFLSKDKNLLLTKKFFPSRADRFFEGGSVCVKAIRHSQKLYPFVEMP